MSVLLRALKVAAGFAVTAAVALVIANYVVERDKLRPGDEADDCDHYESRAADTTAGNAFHDHLLRDDLKRPGL